MSKSIVIAGVLIAGAILVQPVLKVRMENSIQHDLAIQCLKFAPADDDTIEQIVLVHDAACMRLGVKL